jgi:hypothetical protein
MPAWILSLTFAVAFGTTMLAAGTRIGRQRTVATLAQLLERGTFRLVSAEDKPVSMSELSAALGAAPERQTVAPGRLIALALTVACIAGVLAFTIVRSGH